MKKNLRIWLCTFRILIQCSAKFEASHTLRHITVVHAARKTQNSETPRMTDKIQKLSVAQRTQKMAAGLA